MMGVDEIVSKILEDANKEAEKIKEDAQVEASKILDDARKEAEKRKNEILKKGEKEAEMVKNRIIAEAKLKVRKKMLIKREELIEKAIKKLREDLIKLPEKEEYNTLLLKLIIEGIVAIGEEEVFIDLNKRDYEIINSKIMWTIESEMGKLLNKSVIVRKGNIVDIVGGCIVKSKNGSKICDNSLEAVFERNLENIKEKIAELLF
ncbi:V/A-type H+/Na+-transporting ATPase subunit E [Methanofervidicoccus abyssi]|uniref:A-type ATP synthase subunit E n=2 Tax=Methanofervidicoccus abyssi TaxID=2082189 RepID=A0A401HP77_9EURY|nr:V/A-type H+/Na+-transporting ATPase subunit E [Methanofervidicoccus abyssi]